MRAHCETRGLESPFLVETTWTEPELGQLWASVLSQVTVPSPAVTVISASFTS